jgi:hypothetical protein
MPRPGIAINYKALISGCLLGAAIVFVTAELTTNKRLDQYQQSLEEAVLLTQEDVSSLVSLLAAGQSTTATNNIIIDCSAGERDRFETLLGQLDRGPSPTELDEIDSLFGRCASVQAVRRALTLLELTKQVEAFSTLIEQRKQVGEFNAYDDYLDTIKQLLPVEQAMMELSFATVYLQREIIDSLLQNVDSDTLSRLGSEGLSLRNKLNQVAQVAAGLRRELINHESN